MNNLIGAICFLGALSLLICQIISQYNAHKISPPRDDSDKLIDEVLEFVEQQQDNTKNDNYIGQ